MKKTLILTFMLLGFICAISSSYSNEHVITVFNQTQQQTKHIKTVKSTYLVNETISIEYFGLPGNNQDWISLVDASKPDNVFGEWFYTQGKKSGSHTFKALPVGNYEIRVYYNWPTGQYVVHDRFSITVTDNDNKINSNYFVLDKYQKTNQKIVIQYKNLPGHKQDWITLVEASKPDNTFGQWFYTEGKKTGNYTFNAVPPGIYELRLYFNWPDGKYAVKARETIIVK